MANPTFLTPVAGDDPCGPDLRWDPAFIGLVDALAAASAEDEGTVLEAEVLRPDRRTFDEIAAMAAALSARTKDVRVLAVHAEASWRDGGLAAFADAMEDMAAVLETWPAPADGVHPRADDGDLGERAAALGRLLHRIPALAASIGWSDDTTAQRKVESSTTLRGVFGRWKDRLEPAFGSDADLPSATDAWKGLQGLVVASDGTGGPAAEAEAPAAEPGAPAPAADVWDLVDRAAEQMARQDRHSPALPVLQLLAGWRSLDIVEIADAMKPSGISLEQLLESVKKQTRPPG